MSNDFFNPSGTPAQGSQIVTPTMRAEFTAIAAGFDKLPALTGNAYEIVYINASGSAMASVGGDGLLKLSSTGVPTVAAAGTDYTNLAVLSAASAATPNDTDLLPVVDAGTTKKLSLANLKAFFKTYFDTIYAAVAGSVSQVFSAASIELGHASDTTLARVSAGVMSVEGKTVAMLSAVETWSAAQRGAYVTLTDAATIALDLSLGNFFKVQLGGNRTLGAPTNIVAGQSGQIDVYQDGTGSRTLAYAWPYQFVGGTAPTLSTAVAAKDELAYTVNFYNNMTVTGITNGADAVVTSNGHGMFTGQKCQFSALSGSTGLATATSYWATVVDANTFKLSSSLANCQAGTFITTSSAFTSGTLEAATITITPLLAVA